MCWPYTCMSRVSQIVFFNSSEMEAMLPKVQRLFSSLKVNLVRDVAQT